MRYPREGVVAVWLVASATMMQAQGAKKPAAPAKAPAATAKAVTVKEDKPGLLKKAKVTPEAATATALALFPKATVSSAELEEEDGKLVYSFDLKTAGKKGIDEVLVDAMSGKVIKSEHESPADEAKEAKDEKAKSKGKPAAKTP